MHVPFPGAEPLPHGHFTPSKIKYPSIPIYKITPEKRHTLWIVSPSIHYAAVHVVGNRTMGCKEKTAQPCPFHSHDVLTQYWLYVMQPDGDEVLLTRLTQGVLNYELAELELQGGKLRGLPIELWRRDRANIASPMRGRICGVDVRHEITLKAPPMDWALTRLWNAADRQVPWGTKSGVMSPANEPPPVEPSKGKTTTEEALSRDLAALAAGLITKAKFKTRHPHHPLP